MNLFLTKLFSQFEMAFKEKGYRFNSATGWGVNHTGVNNSLAVDLRSKEKVVELADRGHGRDCRENGKEGDGSLCGVPDHGRTVVGVIFDGRVSLVAVNLGNVDPEGAQEAEKRRKDPDDEENHAAEEPGQNHSDRPEHLPHEAAETVKDAPDQEGDGDGLNRLKRRQIKMN